MDFPLLKQNISYDFCHKKAYVTQRVYQGRKISIPQAKINYLGWRLPAHY